CTPCYNSKRRKRYRADPDYRAKQIAQVKAHQASGARIEYDRKRSRDPNRLAAQRTPEFRRHRRERDRERYYRGPEYRAAKIKRAAERLGLRRASQGGAFDTETVWARDGYRCIYCGEPGEHLDHVLPVSKGGPHSYGNLVVACAPCNLRKGATDPLVWFREVFERR